MKRIIFSSAVVIIFCSSLLAQQNQQNNTQKGVDNQTQKIKQEGAKITQADTTVNGSGSGRSWTFGEGKTKVRDRLQNPYRLNSRRDILLETISSVLKEMKILVDEAASRPADGIIVTQPNIFAKGVVTARNELSRYAIIPNSDNVWTRGRYTLTVEVQSIDGIQNNVSVTAKVEGRSENGIQSEWTTLQSSGAAEDEFLVKLVESVTGKAIDAPQDTDQ